jgi:hypothetical protein
MTNIPNIARGSYQTGYTPTDLAECMKLQIFENLSAEKASQEYQKLHNVVVPPSTLRSRSKVHPATVDGTYSKINGNSLLFPAERKALHDWIVACAKNMACLTR